METCWTSLGELEGCWKETGFCCLENEVRYDGIFLPGTCPWMLCGVEIQLREAELQRWDMEQTYCSMVKGLKEALAQVKPRLGTW